MGGKATQAKTRHKKMIKPINIPTITMFDEAGSLIILLLLFESLWLMLGVGADVLLMSMLLSLYRNKFCGAGDSMTRKAARLQKCFCLLQNHSLFSSGHFNSSKPEC
jgi:hypothetical protein